MKNLNKHLYLFVLLVISGGCATDTGLGTGFVPGDNDQPDNSVPYELDDEQPVFSFSRTYTPDASSGTSNDETQAFGEFCVDITDIQNNHEAGTESLLQAKVKVVGTTSDSDIFYSFDGTAEGVDVDVANERFSPLWLAGLTMPLREHGFETAASVTFRTQTGLAPPDQALARALFFDPRPSADGAWGGLLGAEGVDGSKSHAGEIYSYFIDTFGVEFFSGSDFDARAVGDPTCDPDDFDTFCQPFTIQLAWRHNLSVGPAELIGAVVHSLTLDYRHDGSLSNAVELIVPDTNPGASITGPTTGCGSGPCLSGNLGRSATDFASAKCTF